MSMKTRTLWTTLAGALVTAVSVVALSSQTGQQAQKPVEQKPVEQKQAAQKPAEQKPAEQKPAEAAKEPKRAQSVGRGSAARMYNRLDLTEEQRKQVREILDLQRKTETEGQKKVGELQRELQALIFADTPDRAKIDQVKASLAQAEAAALAARIDGDLKISQLLTAEQRAKARGMSTGRGGRGSGRGSQH